MAERFNCPNCGAPVGGAKCEYCGTVFDRTDAGELYDIGKMDIVETVVRITPSGIEILGRRPENG